MSNYLKFIFLFVLVLFTNCKNGQDDVVKANLVPSKNAAFQLLVFKLEKKLELWKVGTNNTFIDSMQLRDVAALPIGQFDLTFDESTQGFSIKFPNVFYESKKYSPDTFQTFIVKKERIPASVQPFFDIAQLSSIIIFPNDNRKGGNLLPCFACPHWMTELYSFLNLKKKEYI